MKGISFFASAWIVSAEDADLSSLLQLKADKQSSDIDCKQGPELCKKKPAPATCAGYICPSGYYQTSTTASCGTSCSTDDCCAEEASCADYVCPSGYYQTSTTATCGTSCSTGDCCAEEASCADYVCPRGFEKLTFIAESTCGSSCSTDQCCTRRTTTTTTTPSTAKVVFTKPPSCVDYQCASGYEKKGRLPSFCRHGACDESQCCEEITTTTTTVRTTTTTTTARTTTTTTTRVRLGRRMTCKMFGDPEVQTFDGMTDKHMGSSSRLDVFKTGTYYIVNAPNIKIQGQFEMVGGLSKSSITNVVLSGAALDNKVLKIARGSSSDQSQAVQFDGRTISSFPYEDAIVRITRVRTRSGYDYLAKFKQDQSVEFFHTPKFFSNVRGGMLDVSIFMNQRSGVTGMCGNMNGRASDDTQYSMNSASLVPSGESLFNGRTIQQTTVTQKGCSTAIKTHGQQWCKTQICGHWACTPSGSKQERRYEACEFDYCNGGQEVAQAGLAFQDESDQVGAIENGEQQMTDSTPDWMKSLLGGGGRGGGFRFR